MFVPSILAATLTFGADASSTTSPLPSETPSTVEIAVNDNRTPAGVLEGGVLTVNLRAGDGVWRPEGPSGPALDIQAFGERGASLVIPAPLIRVVEGTEIAVTISNELKLSMTVHGLCERGGARCSPIDVPAGEVRTTRFKSGPAGTYHYWATTTGMPFAFRAVGDTQLAGAFIVDAERQPKGTDDRVFVITDWTSLTLEQLREIAKADDPGPVFNAIDPQFTFPINGLVWPFTERLTYRLHEPVHWRVLNLSTQAHTMHLHGFYFEVDALGDGLTSATFADDDKQRVVTQLMAPGATLAMTWTPERIGNWLFHCHIRAHVSPERRLGRPGGLSRGHAEQTGHAGHDDGSGGMAGMILGVTVTGGNEARAGTAERMTGARRLRLEMKAEPNRFGSEPAYGFVLTDGEGAGNAARVPIPGPTLILRRGEPVEIALVNHLPEATAIHWHGMELDSYYDGVHGWSGAGQRVTPLIAPGSTFVVRFTPPRAGTFMYHTHLHDDRQLKSGLYGAMLVLDEREVYDDATDHVFIMARGGPGEDAPAVLNGDRMPKSVWTAGGRHRVRLINITPSDIFTVSLQTSEGPVTWRPLAKDGAPLPPNRCRPGPAKQTVGVGETYDFEYDVPPGRRVLWLEVRSPSGRWMNQGQIVVR
jgi:FtsP/CotA-like multicopper oxidase with cupredoxin domain